MIISMRGRPAIFSKSEHTVMWKTGINRKASALSSGYFEFDSWPDEATPILGQESKRPKNCLLSGWEGWHALAPLSITATVANRGCPWAQVCGGGQIALSSMCVAMCCDTAWAELWRSAWHFWRVPEEAHVRPHPPWVVAVVWLKQAGWWVGLDQDQISVKMCSSKLSFNCSASILWLWLHTQPLHGNSYNCSP